MPKRWSLVFLACLLLLGCRAQEGQEAATMEVASPEEGGAVSTAPVQVEEVGPPEVDASEPVPDEPEGIDWSGLDLSPGQASLSCELDYAREGDGTPLTAFDEESLTSRPARNAA